MLRPISPPRISRDEARAVAGETSGCVACALVDGRAGGRVLARGERTVTVVPRVALRLGHVMVVAREHVEAYGEADDALLRELFTVACDLARTIERRLAPPRVYVASLGTGEQGLAVSTPHLHVHVVPLERADERPSEVLTWAHGVLLLSPDHQAEVAAALGLADPPSRL